MTHKQAYIAVCRAVILGCYYAVSCNNTIVRTIGERCFWVYFTGDTADVITTSGYIAVVVAVGEYGVLIFLGNARILCYFIGIIDFIVGKGITDHKNLESVCLGHGNIVGGCN